MTVFGDLSFVMSANLGALGPKDGKPINYHWNWYWNLPRLLPWLLLLILLLRRRNRTPRAAAALIPTLILMGCAVALERLVEMAGGSAGRIVEFTSVVAVGMTAVWLSAGKGSASPRLALSRLALVYLLATSLGIVALDLDDAATAVGGLLISMLGLVFPLYLAGVLAQHFTRRSRALSRFVLALYCGLAVAVLFVALLAAVLVGLFGGPLMGLGAAFAILGYGLVYCLPLGVFVLFTCCSKEYIERWRTELIPPAPIPSAAPAVGGLPEQEPWAAPESGEPPSANDQEPDPKEE